MDWQRPEIKIMRTFFGRLRPANLIESLLASETTAESLLDEIGGQFCFRQRGAA